MNHDFKSLLIADNLLDLLANPSKLIDCDRIPDLDRFSRSRSICLPVSFGDVLILYVHNKCKLDRVEIKEQLCQTLREK